MPDVVTPQTPNPAPSVAPVPDPATGLYFHQDVRFISPVAGDWFDTMDARDTARSEGVPPRLSLALILLVDGIETDVFFADTTDGGAAQILVAFEALQLLRELAARLESELRGEVVGMERYLRAKLADLETLPVGQNEVTP